MTSLHPVFPRIRSDPTDSLPDAAYYHIFLVEHTAGREDTIQIISDLSSPAAVEDCIHQCIPARGDVRHPTPLPLIFVYGSVRPYAALRLPDGRTPVGRPSEYVHYFFLRGMVPGVTPCTERFLTSAPAPALPARPPSPVSPLPNDGIASAPDAAISVPRGLVHILRERLVSPVLHPDYAWVRALVYTLLTLYAGVAPFLLSLLIRAAWTGTFAPLDLVTLESVAILAVAIGTLLVAQRFVEPRRGAGLLALVEIGVLLGILVVTVRHEFLFFQGAIPLLLYSTPVVVMILGVAVATYILFVHVDAFTIPERVLIVKQLATTSRPITLLAAAALVLSLGGISLIPTTPLHRLSLLAIIGALFVGVVLTLVALHVKRHELQTILHDTPPFPSISTLQRQGALTHTPAASTLAVNTRTAPETATRES